MVLRKTTTVAEANGGRCPAPSPSFADGRMDGRTRTPPRRDDCEGSQGAAA
jgi:hypothetical protein